MDTREEFYKIIYDYYFKIATDKIPEEYLIKLSDLVTDYYYKQYQRFGTQYPKSVKRYSTFKVVDLEHPSTYEIIIKFFKGNIGSEYADFAKIILQKDDLQLQKFEKMMSDYYNK